MRFKWRFIFFLSFLAANLQASDPQIVKVLPHYLDSKGRNALSPTLYERDAYQDFLRDHPEQCSALRFDVQWKSKPLQGKELKLRIELRGAKGNSIQEVTLEQPARRRSWFSNWTALKLQGESFRNFGQLVSWRATLWDGDKQVAERKSFLW